MARIDAKTFSRYASDPAAFRADLIVDVDGTARRFGDVMDPWQREDFLALDDTQYLHAYLERPRGHSKTGDVGSEACVELLTCPDGAARRFFLNHS